MRRALPRPGRPSRRARRLTLAASGGAALVLATALVRHTAPPGRRLTADEIAGQYLAGK